MAERRHTEGVRAHALGGAFTSQATKGAQPKSRERTCAKSGCDTVLSKYNEADYCSVHESPYTPYGYKNWVKRG